MLTEVSEFSVSPQRILVVNAGSSSLKAGVYATVPMLTREAEFSLKKIDNTTDAIAQFIDWLRTQNNSQPIDAIGHRIVHGGRMHDGAQLITPTLLAELQEFAQFDTDHLPTALSIIQALTTEFSHLQQFASFDTSFFNDLPANARLLGLPRRFHDELQVQRFGFHGLSYEYLLGEFRRHEGEVAANGRVILAHMGSGVSLTALQGGKPIDTTMGFTPAGGVIMSSRSGDIDPGLVLYLHQKTGMDFYEFDRMINHESGLLGVSGISADMRELIEKKDTDPHASEAVALFCYQAKKTIGSFAAALGGVDSIIFAGGIGEQAPYIREQICDGLEFLGVRIDPDRNARHDRLISAPESSVGVHVIHTDEALIIAQHVQQIIQRTTKQA